MPIYIFLRDNLENFASKMYYSQILRRFRRDTRKARLSNSMRTDHCGVDLISDVLPFGRLSLSPSGRIDYGFHLWKIIEGSNAQLGEPNLRVHPK